MADVATVGTTPELLENKSLQIVKIIVQLIRMVMMMMMIIMMMRMKSKCDILTNLPGSLSPVLLLLKIYFPDRAIM